MAASIKIINATAWRLVLLVALSEALSLSRRDALGGLAVGFAVPVVANAFPVPGGEFCVCNPEGDCFGQNCGGLAVLQNPYAPSIADARAAYRAELSATADALRKTRSRKDDDDDSPSISPSEKVTDLSSTARRQAAATGPTAD